jgi:hypothetical protein
MGGCVRSDGLQDGHYGHSAMEEVEPRRAVLVKCRVVAQRSDLAVRRANKVDCPLVSIVVEVPDRVEGSAARSETSGCCGRLGLAAHDSVGRTGVPGVLHSH